MKNQFTQSTILNHRGQPIFRRQASGMYDASYPYKHLTRVINNSGVYNNDFHTNVSDGDFRLLLSRARELYANLGAIKSAINEIAELTVGDAWLPKYTGPDTEWGDMMEDWLYQWYQVCDVKGQPWNLHNALKLASVSVDRDGDVLCVLTSAADGKFPKIQWIEAHNIAYEGDVIEEGIFTGYQVRNGVILNDFGAVVGFSIKSKNGYTQISSQNAQLVCDPEYFSQERGLTALAAAINDWDDYKTIKNFEIRGIKHASNFAVQMFVPEEEMDDHAGEYADSPFVSKATSSGGRNLNIETLQGGETLIFKPDSGAKLEVLNSNRPSTNTATFLLDHVLRHAFLSLRWPVEMAFDLNSRGSTTKIVAQKVQRRICDRQNRVIYPVWKRIITYAVAKAIKAGYLPQSVDWWNYLDYTPPKDFSVEAYRDRKTDLELYSKGMITGTQMASQEGYDYHENLEQKAKEIADAKVIAEEYGIDPNQLITNSTPNGTLVSSQSTPVEDSEDTEDSQDTTPN